MVDLLMWVGYEHYPTIGAFVDEAKRLGLSKRIGRLPQGVEIGKSRLFFAHDEGCPPEASVVFGHALISGIEVLARDEDESSERVEAASARLHVEPETIRVVVMGGDVPEEPRGCGYRTEPGSTYLVSGQGRKPKTTWWGSGEALSYTQAVTVQEGKSRLRFRGAMKVDGDLLLQLPREALYPVEATPAEFELPDLPPRTPWTVEERRVLALLVKREGTYRGSKAFARMSPCRGLEAAMYQVRQLFDLDEELIEGIETL